MSETESNAIDAPGAVIPCSQDQQSEQEQNGQPGAIAEPGHAPKPAPAPGNLPHYDPPEYLPLSITQNIVGNYFTPSWDAYRFYDRYCASVRYCATLDQFYIWNGLLWEPDEIGKIQQLCREQIEDTIRDPHALNTEALLKHLIRSLTPAGVRDTIFFLKANMLTVREEELDADKDRINVLNGVINLSTVQYEHPHRDRIITRRMNADYDPAAQCPAWREHLNLIFAGDQDTIASFQMIAGYALLRLNPEQLFFILYGAGENGKSVTLNVLSFILGEYAANADPRTFMHRRSDDNAVRSDIARLYHAHLVTAIESSEGVRLNEGLIKAITGHDKITSRELYEKEQERYLDAKIFFATNHEPVIKDTTHGMLRRIVKVPFMVQIPPDKRNDQIEDLLKAEAPGIFNWLLDGLRAWHENGRKIKLSPAITTATNTFRDTIDVYREFFTDDMEITGDPKDTISKKEVLEFARLWYADKHGEQPVIGLTAFNKICEEHGYKKDKRTKIGYVWIGVRHISPIEREARAIKREEQEKAERDARTQAEQARKHLSGVIGQMIKDGKKAHEIDEFIENAYAEGELVNLGEPHLVSSQTTDHEGSLLDKVHPGSPVHPARLKTSKGYSCGSMCSPLDAEKCKLSPDVCGRGSRFTEGS